MVYVDLVHLDTSGREVAPAPEVFGHGRVLTPVCGVAEMPETTETYVSPFANSDAVSGASPPQQGSGSIIRSSRQPIAGASVAPLPNHEPDDLAQQNAEPRCAPQCHGIILVQTLERGRVTRAWLRNQGLRLCPPPGPHGEWQPYVMCTSQDLCPHGLLSLESALESVLGSLQAAGSPVSGSAGLGQHASRGAEHAALASGRGHAHAQPQPASHRRGALSVMDCIFTYFTGCRPWDVALSGNLPLVRRPLPALPLTRLYAVFWRPGAGSCCECGL